MKKFYTLLFIVPFFLHAQCPQRYLDRVFSNVRFHSSVRYAGARMNIDCTWTWLGSDIYEPDVDTAQLRPLVFLIHGGGFTNFPPLFRSSPDIVEMATDLAKRGYVAVSPEYRLFSGDNSSLKMIQTVMAASIDINDAVCFFVNSVAQGNPYHIDTSKFFIGGNSAGGLLALNAGVFLDDTSQLDSYYRTILNSVAAFDHRNPEELLQNKLCGVHVSGAISMSGAMIDTSLMRYKSAGLLLIHGGIDSTIPYKAGNVYYNPSLPVVYGSSAIYQKAMQLGMQAEYDFYPDLGHVPILWNFSNDIPGALLNTITHGSIFNKPILDSTEMHIARFCYRLIGSPETRCDPTGISNNIFSGELKIFPNPSSGNFNVEIPIELRGKKINVEVQNLVGQVIYENILEGSGNITVNLSGQSGMFLFKINTAENGSPVMYINKIIVQ